MKTTIIVMAVAVFNLYLAAGNRPEKGIGLPAASGLRQPDFTAPGGMEFRALDGSSARFRTASDTGGYRPSLASLKESVNGTRFTLSFSSFGCFRQYARLLRFEQTDAGVTVSMFESGATAVNQPEGRLLATRVMGESEWAAWQVLEDGLYTQRDGGCTTNERYVLTNVSGSATIMDASCQWFGFNKLIDTLFGEQESRMRVIAG